MVEACWPKILIIHTSRLTACPHENVSTFFFNNLKYKIILSGKLFIRENYSYWKIIIKLTKLKYENLIYVFPVFSRKQKQS